MIAQLLFTLACMCLIMLSEGSEQTQGAIDRLRCYKCDSVYDPACADPFDIVVGAKFIVSCDDESSKPLNAKSMRPVGCRKIDQHVLDKVTVVRQCAYSGHNMTGIKRPGNKGIVKYLNQCSTQECNKGKLRVSSSFAAVVAPLVFAFILRYHF